MTEKFKIAPELSQQFKTKKKFRVGIVCANFNPQITGKMLKAAREYCQKENLTVKKILEVPGSLEISLGCQRLFKQPGIDAVVALGAIIKGSTDHDQIIGYGIAQSLLDVSLKFDKPVGMGITGPGQTEEQASARAEEYARRAVLAVKQMLLLQ